MPKTPQVQARGSLPLNLCIWVQAWEWLTDQSRGTLIISKDWKRKPPTSPFFLTTSATRTLLILALQHGLCTVPGSVYPKAPSIYRQSFVCLPSIFPNPISFTQLKWKNFKAFHDTILYTETDTHHHIHTPHKEINDTGLYRPLTTPSPSTLLASQNNLFPKAHSTFAFCFFVFNIYFFLPCVRL